MVETLVPRLIGVKLKLLILNTKRSRVLDQDSLSQGLRIITRIYRSMGAGCSSWDADGARKIRLRRALLAESRHACSERYSSAC